MTFANPLPWWLIAAILAAAALLSWHTYRRMAARPRRRGVLTALRFVTLILLVLLLMRPVVPTAAADQRLTIVPILVDTSRSMSIADQGAARRIDRARQLISMRLMPELGARFQVEVLGFAEHVQLQSPEQLAATGRVSDVQTALRAVRDRYQGQLVAGIILLSDGGETADDQLSVIEDPVPVYPIGIGEPTMDGDAEILSVTAADAILDDSKVTIAVTAVRHESVDAVELRLTENGKPTQVARVTPAGPGVPVYHQFQVAPSRGSDAVYKVETPAGPADAVPENNARQVLVQGVTRPKRILLVEGAPGFDHSFLKRAWAADPGLDVDAVVRKGTDDQGRPTFYIQAAQSRISGLVSGYPQKREDLLAYDAVVLANVDRNLLTAAQLEATRDFVLRRGGGLLVLGAASFSRVGLIGSALADAVPLQLEGGGAEVTTGARAGAVVSVTPAGASHPIMQVAADADTTKKRWEAMPPLAGVASIGGPRPGASVLALYSGGGGGVRALVAVQRYGEGRGMAFTGEASWRWRMLMPSSDRTYDTFWRQAARWLALPTTDPIRLTLPADAAPGDAATLRVEVRDAAFAAVGDASVTLRLTAPDGSAETLTATPSRSGADPALTAIFRPTQAGVYRVTADARRGSAALGSARGAVLVGGVDREMADPRLDLPALQRIALASRGRTLAEADLSGLADLLKISDQQGAHAATRDLWHSGWSFLVIVGLLTAEWTLRRRWGLP